jgi:hypothetical protein
VEAPDGLTMTVTPSTLEFRNMNEQRSYDVKFLSKVVKPAGAWDFGKIIWKSVDHKVVRTSPTDAQYFGALYIVPPAL